MADNSVRDHNSVFNAPLQQMDGGRISRRIPPYPEPRNIEGHRKLDAALMSHAYALCKALGIKFNPSDIDYLVFRACGRRMLRARSWEWLLESLLKNEPQLREQSDVALAVAFMRGRLVGIDEDDRRLIASQIGKDRMSHRRQQFAAERDGNGGDQDFFSAASWKKLRYEVLSESGGRCALCGRSYRDHGVQLEVDHIKPRSRFPALSLVKSNLQVLCSDCNLGKGNRDDRDWRTQKDGPAAPNCPLDGA